MYEDRIKDQLDEIVSYKQEFGENTEEGHLNKITSTLTDLEDHIREQIQSVTKPEIETIIKKLKSGSEINDADLMMVRLWIVGDAQAYIEMENDYRGWLLELNRLFGVIEDLKSEELDLEKMYKLSGTVRDTIRVIADIVFFKQQQERVKNYENASQNLNSENKLILANILQKKHKSADV
jgi:hypothetical protein